MYEIGTYISDTGLCKIEIHGIKSDTVGASIYFLSIDNNYELYEQGIYDYENIRIMLRDELYENEEIVNA